MFDLKTVFYYWLYKFKRNVVRKKSGLDFKCSVCKEWHSDIISQGYDIYYFQGKNKDVFGFTCYKCEHTDYWNSAIAPVAIRSYENGTPIQ